MESKYFHPIRAIYDWGQYGSLRDALDNNPILIKATYWYQHPLNVWKTQITNISIIDINELAALPSSEGGLIEQLQHINKELKILNTKLEKKL